MGFLDQKLSDLSLGDLRHLIRTEVSLQTPPIPAGVRNLSDLDVPLVQPDTAAQGQAIVFNAATGGWEVGSLGIIDGSVTNEQIESVSGSKITAGILSAQLTLTGRLATAISGQRMEVDGGGLRAYDASNTVEVNIAADGTTSTFQGNLVTGNLQVNGGLTIDGATNIMDKGSVLTLNEAVSNPNAAPALAYGFDSTKNFTDESVGNVPKGMSYNATGFGSQPTWTYIADAQSPSAGPHRPQIVELKASDGSFLRSITVDTTHSKSLELGVAVIANNTYEIWTTSGGTVKMDKYDSTYTYVSTVTLSIPGSFISSGFGVTTDGTNIIVAVPNSFSSGHVNLYTVTPGGGVSNVIQTGGHTYTSGDLTLGAAYDGTNVWVAIHSSATGETIVEPYHAGAYVTNTGFAIYGSKSSGNTTPWAGIGHDGTNGWMIWEQPDNGQGAIVKLTGLTWTPGTDKWYFAHEWTDGTFVTNLSALATLNLASSTTSRPYMRGQFSVSLPSLPAGMTGADIYTDNAASTPGAGLMHKQAANQTSPFTLASYNAAGAAPPTSTFPGGTSSILGVFSAGTAPWKIGGDGTFQLPVLASSARLPLATTGQLGLNTTNGGVDVHDGVGYSSLAGPESGLTQLRRRLYEAAATALVIRGMNFDQALAKDTFTYSTSGTTRWYAVYWPGGTCTGHYYFIDTAAGAYTDASSRSGTALYSTNGTTLTRQAAFTSTLSEGTGVRKRTWTTPATLAAGIYYVAIRFVFSAGTPTIVFRVLNNGDSTSLGGDVNNASTPNNWNLGFTSSDATQAPPSTQAISGLAGAGAIGWIGLF